MKDRTFECVIQVEGQMPPQGTIKARTTIDAGQEFCKTRLDGAQLGAGRREGSFIRRGRLMECMSFAVRGHNRLYIYEEVHLK